MDYNEILEKARGRVAPYCKACPVCNGIACAHNMPGPGPKQPGNGAARNYEAWQRVFVNMDTICSNDAPDTTFKLYGHEFSLPVFIAPVGGVALHYGDDYNDFTYNDVIIPAAAECGSAAFSGDGVDPEVMKRASATMAQLGGMGIPTIKPWNIEAVEEKLGAVTVNAAKEDAVQAILEKTQGRGVDLVFEAAGNPASILQTASLVARGGTIVLIGLSAEGVLPFDLGKIMNKEAEIKTVFRYRNVYPWAIEAVRSGRVNVKSLVTHRYAFEDSQRAFSEAVTEKARIVKGVIHL